MAATSRSQYLTLSRMCVSNVPVGEACGAGEEEEMWCEVVQGTRRVASARLRRSGGELLWPDPLEIVLSASGDVPFLRVVTGRPRGSQEELVSASLDCLLGGEEDVTLGVGPRGRFSCTAWLGGSPGNAPQRGTGGLLQAVLGDPTMPLGSFGLRRSSVTSTSDLGSRRGSQDSSHLSRRGSSEETLRWRRGSVDEVHETTDSPIFDRQRLATLGPAVEARLLDLLTEFFSLDGTSAFTSLALQNVKFGLAADARMSPFAKPRLPRAPSRAQRRWSVDGGNLQTPAPRRDRAVRQTWHTADARMRSSYGALDEETPVALQSLPGLGRRGVELLASASRDLSSSPASIPPSASDEASALEDMSTIWLPVPEITVEGILAGKGTPDATAGEVVSEERARRDEAIQRTAERAAKALSQSLGSDDDLLLDGMSPSSPVRGPLERVREKRRSSVLVSQPEDSLRGRVVDAFGPRAALEYEDFLKMCFEVLEVPQYVGHAIFELLTQPDAPAGLGGALAGEGAPAGAVAGGAAGGERRSVTLRALDVHMGGLRAEVKDDKRRVFNALAGARAARTISLKRPHGPGLGAGPGAEPNADGASGGASGGGPSGPPEVSERAVRLVVEGVLALHPGLAFLQDHDEFKEAYVRTVTTRLVFTLAGPGRRGVPWSLWRRSDITDVLFALHDEADINRAPDYFSYNDFYVIWCLFWELDEDEDTQISEADLLRYNNYSLSPRAVARVVGLAYGARGVAGKGVGSSTAAAPAADPAGAETRRSGAEEGDADAPGRSSAEASKPGTAAMDYDDFVRFMVAEEHKDLPCSLRYWFHVLDVDADGVLGRKDLEYFYEEQESRCAPVPPTRPAHLA
mmetsp:Transcript_1098/g.3388  ORF Transcript_1098/g.3388 Transcript_1098/m.3388 type:complete len:858 (+) Transcript_1098:111-2684(+)